MLKKVIIRKRETGKMNSRDLKDLIYAYLSHNYDVYMDGDERAVIARHVCANEKCKSS